jgi:HAD superfamily hydrolase (TIGR01662 family)
MTRSIQAILFDLGDTLIHAKDPWPPVFESAGQALTDSLCAAGLPVECDTFHAAFDSRLRDYYETRETDFYERTTAEVLRNLLAEKGIPDVSDRTLRAALDALYAVTQANWFPEDDAAATLAELQAMGYRLGLVSNAGDDKDVHDLVEKTGIDHFFDFILTSAACSYRKPHPRIFGTALAHWTIKPDQVAMVGDRLEADIRGAKRAGMVGIWIRRRAAGSDRIAPDLEPDAIIDTLSELPTLLRDKEF